MSLLGQLLPNSYEAGAVRTYRDVLSRTGAISAALARSGQLNAETDSRIEDFHRCLLAVLDGTGRHSRVRAATDGILADSADERDTLADRLLGRRGTLKLFSRLASVLSSLESDPAGVWQAYRVMMESYLSRMGYPVGMAPRPNIYASARRVAQIPAEFDQTYREVSNVFPHAGRVAFLEECVRRGSCLERCRDISASAMAELLPESCEYWDYRNVLRLAQTAERLDESRLSVSLSGGNSNGLAHLGALESLTDEDGTLSDSVGLIAGTSMGGIMAALAAVAPVPRLQRDIVEGFSLAGRSYRLEGHTSDARDRERIVEFFLALGRRYGIRENTRFSDLPIPVVVAASRDLPRGAQKVLLWGDDLVVDSLRAASNFRFPIINTPLFGDTRIDGTLLTDDAASEEGNAIDILERLSMVYRQMVAIDVGYSSDRYDAASTRGERAGVRRMFKLATTRDILWKATLALSGGRIADVDPTPSANARGERFSPECSERLFAIGRAAGETLRSRAA